MGNNKRAQSRGSSSDSRWTSDTQLSAAVWVRIWKVAFTQGNRFEAGADFTSKCDGIYCSVGLQLM